MPTSNIPVSIHHPLTILRTKVPAEKLVNKVKDKLIPEEIEFVQILIKDNSFESVVEKILVQAGNQRDQNDISNK